MKGLYLVTDRAMAGVRDLDEVVAAAVRGGARMVQLREKNVSTRLFIEQAESLKKLLEPLGLPLIINDRVDVALAAGVSGVHLGQNDMPYAMARRLMGPEAVIGVSVENLQQVDDLKGTDVDYLGVSGIFPTPTKRDLPGYWQLDGLQAVRNRTHLPLVAIGGINLENARQVIDAGADMIAVVSAICCADNPETAARQLARLIAE